MMDGKGSRLRDYFVGRKDELSTFEHILQCAGAELRTLFIQGPGGIGKTWLIEEMLTKAKSHSKYLVPDQLIDMYSTTNRHIEGVIAAIVVRLRPLVEATMLAEYDDARDALESARATPDYSQEGIESRLESLIEAFLGCLKEIAGQTPVVLAFDTFEHVQAGPVGSWILSEEGLQLPGMICLVGSRSPLAPEMKESWIRTIGLTTLTDEEAMDLYYKVSYSEEKRTPDLEAFVAELNAKAEGNPLLLSLAILWLQLEPDTSAKRLAQLSQEKFEQGIVSWLHPETGAGSLYLGGRDLDEPMRQTLVCMAYLNRRFNRFFLNHLVANRYVQAHGVTEDRIWEQLERREPDFFFVKERPEGEVQLHDKLAGMLRKHLLPQAFESVDLTGDKLKALARDVVTWYDELIQTSGLEISKDVLRLEKLAYVLQLDILADLRQPDLAVARASYPLQPDFDQAKALLIDYRRLRSDVLDRLILGEIRQDVVELFPFAEQYEIYEMLGDIARRAYRLEQAVEFWQRAFEIARQMKDPKLEVKALIGQHNSTWQRDPEASLGILVEALRICDDSDAKQLRPEVLYETGFAHRQLENLEEAVKWYQQAQEMAEHYQDRVIMSTVLNDMGFALLRMGNYDQAEAFIKTAADLREHQLNMHRGRMIQAESPEDKESIKDQIREATLELGMTYNTSGQMERFRGDLAAAIGDHSEAFALFSEVGSQLWQARALQLRGEANRRIAKTLYDRGRRAASITYDQSAFEDISTSLELCEQYGLDQELDTVNRRMGRLLHDRFFRQDEPDDKLELLDRALQHFETAVKIAQDTGDTLEELEILTEIAFLADDCLATLRQYYPDRARQGAHQVAAYIERLYQGIEEHRDDEPRIYQYPVFEHLLQIERGAFYYALGDYDQALEHYIEGYVGMASDPGYGSARYREHIDHLFINIKALGDIELARKWYERFINEWEKGRMQDQTGRSLAEAHPEFIERCRLNLSTAFMLRRMPAVRHRGELDLC